MHWSMLKIGGNSARIKKNNNKGYSICALCQISGGLTRNVLSAISHLPVHMADVRKHLESVHVIS